MLRQLTLIAVITLIAITGVGGFLVTSGSSQNAIAEKEQVAPAEPVKLQTDSRLLERTRRMDEINQILASRVPQFAASTHSGSGVSPEDLRDPKLERIYQQLRKQRLSIRFPEESGPLLIWVGNPSRMVDGQKVYEHTQVLKNSVPLLNQLPFPVRIWFYGTRDQSNPELGECIETLAGIQQLGGLKFSYCRISERGYTALRNLPQLTDLEILHSHLDAAALEQIAEINSLNRLHLHFDDRKIPLATAQKVLDLPQLEDFKLKVRLDRKDVGAFWNKLAECETLTSLEIDCGFVSQKMMIQFLKKGDRQRLRSWIIREQIPRKHLADALIHAPNLESLKTPAGSADEMIYLIEQLVKTHPHLRSLIIGWDTGEHLSGRQARETLRLLAAFSEMRNMHVPIVLPSIQSLESLTKLHHLEHFYCKNLNLNQDSLFYLAQMPSLKSLRVNSLAFNDESSHLLPWLSHVETIEIENPHTLTDRRLRLLASLPQLKELKWCDIAVDKPVPLSQTVRDRYPFIKYNICGD